MQRRLRNGQITIAEADAALDTVTTVGVRIYTHPDMVHRARAMARQFHQERIDDSLYARLRNCAGG